MQTSLPTTRWGLLCGWLLCATACLADGEFPVRVTRNGATIKDVNQVVGTASRDMLLWTTKLSPDGQWAYVKVPAADRMGWISVGDVANIEIAGDRSDQWTKAHAYFDEWQALVEDGLHADAAKLAESSASQMNSILEDLIGSVYPGYPPAATAMNQAGVAMMQTSDVVESQRLFGQAIEIAEAAIGSIHPHTCVYRANLADTLVRTARYGDAISAFDLALPVLEQNRDQLNSIALDTYFVQYGTALAHEHRIFDARIAFGKALRSVSARHGERSAEVARVETQFANAMDQAGEHEGAVRQLVRSLDIYREITDEESPIMIDTLNRLSAFTSRAGQFEAALKYANEAVIIQRGIDEPSPFQMASSLSNLGLAQAETKDFSAAKKSLDEAVQRMEAASEANSFVSTFPLKNLGILALRQNDLPLAKSTFQRVLDLRRATKSADDVSVGEAYSQLAEVSFAEGDTIRGRQNLMEAVRIQGNANGIDHPDSWRNVMKLRKLIGDDNTAHGELDLVIADARRDMRNQILLDVPESDYQLERVAAEYRLQRILAGRQKSAPETQFFALEITEENASVRTSDLIATTLPRDTVVYAFRARGDQALIKIPGKNKLGWIGQNSISEVKYSGELLNVLAKADEELDLGLKEHLEGNDKNALLRIRSALKIFDEELGEDSAPAAAARFTLGGVLASAGDARVAVDECRNAEAVLADLLGESHFETAKARNNLADALLSLGKPAEALRPAAQALQTASGFVDEQREFQAKVAGNVGLALTKLTHYEAAREYFDYALKLSLEANGENHFGTARCYSHLGALHTELKEYSDAEAALGKAYRIAERVSGPTNPDTTRAMVSLGNALIANQKIADGRRLIEEASRINLRERGPMDLSTIRSDAARAAIALTVGNSNSARTAFESVVRRSSRRLGEEHPDVLQYRALLAEALYLDGQLERALVEAEDVAGELRTSFDDTTHATIDSIRSVGVYSAALGRLDVARVNYEKALRLAQKVLGPDHPDTVDCLLNIGEVALMAKDYVAARPRIEATTVTMQREQPHVVTAACVARTMLGYIDVGQGDTRNAVRTFDRAAKDTFELMSTVLPALSEKEQLMFLQNDLREMQDAWMTLPIVAAENSEVAAYSTMWHLNMKASSHELLATQARVAREGSTVENKVALEELIRVREKLARLSLRTVSPDARATHQEAVAKLTLEEERLARELGDVAASLSEARKWISEETFRTELPESAVLVNFARIRNANFAYSSEKTKWKGDRYLACVIPPEGRGDIVVVDLGLAEAIDQRIAIALDAIHSDSAISAFRSLGEQQAAVKAGAALQSLAAKVLSPILAHVDPFEQLILSPDGELWTIPWAALPIGDQQLAIEKFQIRLAVSGRELLSSPAGQQNSVPAPPMIVADPSFDMNPGLTLAANDLDSTRTRSAATRFGDQFRNAKRLPGTAAEAAAISDSVESFAGAAPTAFLQKTATEAVVKNAKSPRCLVLSTHGFFFEAPQRRASSRNRSDAAAIPENPLLRCGLLMAGCHYADEAAEGTDDGILTGMEIVNTDLRNTDLVVLSACETGLGDLRSGEGVAGLRQAFQLAGAKSVVASLWQVEDKATAKLMNDFFRNLANGMTKSESLRQAQLTRIQSRRERNGAAHPFFWAAFTLTGDD